MPTSTHITCTEKKERERVAVGIKKKRGIDTNDTKKLYYSKNDIFF